MKISSNIEGVPIAAPADGVAADVFRRGMRRLAGGVSLVAATHGGRRYGLAATAVCPVSIEPPLLLVCINRASSSHEPVRLSGQFCVNVLGEGDADLARCFGASEFRDRRFESKRWTSIATGAPALAGALASFDCEVSEEVAAHTHTIFIGRIVAVELWAADRTPLVYFDGGYATLAATG